MSSLLERARRCMPGGVSSPVRAFGSVEGDPPFVARGAGGSIFDTQGREYVDLVGSWGPLILGHAHPAVVAAVTRAARDGLTFGATCAAEVELAERVLARFPRADKLRFVSSGTEAVMSAVRLARGATGRARILKFEGCYHGHSDGLLVRAGSGLLTIGDGAQPSSAGVPAEIARLTDVLPLDDDAALRDYFAQRGGDLAAVLIEPLPANAGLLVQRAEFLKLLRELSRKAGALLICDEVISGFRIAPGGATERFGLDPDIVTLGKILGGGMPVGAYLARAELMDHVAPLGPVYQAGTLSGNPLAMAAGLATLDVLDDTKSYARLEQLGARLEAHWSSALARHDVAGSVVRVGSILWIALQAGSAPRAAASIDPRAARLYGRLHPAALARGLWLAPSAYEVAFVSLAHDEASIDRAGAALDGALAAALVGGTA
jgi:glutamate-1-semialdehyde 2,1-aminomutase